VEPLFSALLSKFTAIQMTRSHGKVVLMEDKLELQEVFLVVLVLLKVLLVENIAHNAELVLPLAPSFAQDADLHNNLIKKNLN